MVKLTDKKIPVKVVQVTNIHGEKKIGVMLDLSYYLGEETNLDQKVQVFRDLYLCTVMKARKIFYGQDKGETKKYRDLPSSTYWMLGDVLSQFNDEIENEFIITNYAVALERDFGLSRGYVHELLKFVKLFKQNEVLDLIPMSYYRVLMRKRSQLEKLGIFEREKVQLLNIGRQDKLPGRENYKRELAHLTLCLSSTRESIGKSLK